MIWVWSLVQIDVFYLLLGVSLLATRYNIQKFYIVLALRSVIYKDLRTDSNFRFLHHLLSGFITVVESVYSAVRTDSLYKADYVCFEKVKYKPRIFSLILSRPWAYQYSESRWNFYIRFVTKGYFADSNSHTHAHTLTHPYRT